MSEEPFRKFRAWPSCAAVVAVCAIFAAMSRVPSPSRGEAPTLAGSFRFTREPLFVSPVPAGISHEVNRNASHMRYYLYQVGASGAIGDLDGDGLANDLCYTDVRAKSVTLSPAPDTGRRYAPWVINFGAAFDAITQNPTLCRFADLNEDGRQDVYVAFAGRAPIVLLRRDDDARGAAATAFVQRDLLAGERGIWYTATTTFADIDGDGHLDVVLGNYFADGARVYDASSDEPFEMNASFSHARNGGTSRILLWTGSSAGASPMVSYREIKDFQPDGGARAWTLALGAADLDGDGLPELYVANDFGPDQLLYNQSTPGRVRFIGLYGTRGFLSPKSFVLGNDSFKGMGVDFGDVNGDGRFDIFVSNIARDFALQETHFLWASTDAFSTMARGVAPYVNRSVEYGVAHSAWGWDARFDDMDNDGRLELLQATGFMRALEGAPVNRWANIAQLGMVNDAVTHDPHTWPTFPPSSDIDGAVPCPFWVLGREGRYVDLSDRLFPGFHPNARAIATADVDGDGDLDLLYANQWADPAFFRNDAPHPGRFLGLHVLRSVAGAPAAGGVSWVHDGHPALREGTPATGAIVRLALPDGRRFLRLVDGGNGHSGQRSPDVHVGLGDVPAHAQISVAIAWRDLMGARHETSLTMGPGWHTIRLGPGAR